MKALAEFKQEQFKKDFELKRLYDESEPEYVLIRQILDARIKGKLSQADLAAKMGTKQSAVARLESGNANPSLRTLKKVAAATGTRLKLSFEK